MKSENKKSIESFDGTNMVRWEPAMQGHLMSKKLWTKLKKIKPKNDEKRGSDSYLKRLEDEELDEANAEIIGKISENVNHCFRTTVLQMDYADEVWDYFQRLYKPETEIGANGVISRKKFYSMQLKEGENISNFLAEVYGHAQDLKISDDEIREFIIQGALPESFDIWIDSIKDNVKYAKWPEFRAKIEKEGLLKGYVNDRNDNPSRVRSVQENNRGSYQTKRFNGRCFKCGKVGHRATECRGEIICFACKKTGHKSNDCQENKKEKSAKEVKFVIEVTRQNKLEEEQQRGTMETRKEKLKEMKPMEVMATNKINHKYDDAVELVNWKYDTACSDSCTPRRDLFTTYQDCNEEFHTAKKGHTMKIIGKGTILFQSNAGVVELTDVLHCEELSSNLLSGSDIQSKGVTVLLGEEIKLMKNGTTICTGMIQDRAWIIELAIIKEENNKTVEEVNQGCININHRRMGHIAELKEGEFCEVCIKAKATANRKNRRSINRQPTKGLVHMDLFGPIYGLYFGIVIYDLSDEVALLKLKRKSDFFENWTNLAKLWAAQYESPIKMIKCDGGGEFINKNMEDWCRQNGCEIFMRNPYVKWQIGVVERRIRTVTNMANCMLLDSKLDIEKYFVDALFTAVYLLNRQTSKFTGKIPTEERMGRKVNPKYFKVWGSTAFVLIQKETRKGKFGDKARKGILVGYSHSGYIIELTNGERVISRDVKFDESFIRNEKENYSSSSDDSESDDDEIQNETKSTRNLHDDTIYLSAQEDDYLNSDEEENRLIAEKQRSTIELLREREPETK